MVGIFRGVGKKPFCCDRDMTCLKAPRGREPTTSGLLDNVLGETRALLIELERF